VLKSVENLEWLPIEFDWEIKKRKSKVSLPAVYPTQWLTSSKKIHLLVKNSVLRLKRGPILYHCTGISSGCLGDLNEKK
jgi:hypothetical protein